MPEGLLLALLAGVTVTAVGVPLAVRVRRGPPDPLRRWARGAYGLLTGGEDFGELGRDEARGILESPWKIENARGLERTIAELEAGDTDNPGWDLVRVILLARLGAAAGYLGAERSWALVARAGQRLQQTYPDWPALARAYGEGRSHWLHARGLKDVSNHALVERNSAVLARRVWPRVEFRTPLRHDPVS